MSYLLRLRQLINSPESLDMSQEYVPLDHSPHPAILVYGESLSLTLLRSDKLAPTNFIQYYKKLLKLSEDSLPTLDDLFKYAPPLLHGEQHIQAKKAFSNKYRIIEESLQNYLPTYSEEFFKSIAATNEINPIELVTNYIAGFFRTVLANDLKIDVDLIPTLPSKIFFLTQPLARLNDVEEKLRILKDFLENTLLSQKRNLAETWMLLSILVAGFEALEGTLMYGITKDPPSDGHWNVKQLIKESAAVNFIGRRALENFSINNFSMIKNQELFVCPPLVHLHLDANNSNTNNHSFAFGKGAHSCIGQAIAEDVIGSFFSQWPLFLKRHPKFLQVKNTRDFNLVFSLKQLSISRIR